MRWLMVWISHGQEISARWHGSGGDAAEVRDQAMTGRA
jgi:hypothetical protein